MGKHFHCTDEIIVVSKGKEDIGKVPALGNDGKLDPSVIPEMEGKACQAIAGCAEPSKDWPISGATPTTAIPVDKVIFDTGEFFNGDGKAHITKDGIYIITAVVTYSASNTGSRHTYIIKNGNDYLSAGSAASSDTSEAVDPSTSIVAMLKAGDYIELCGACLARGSSITIQTHEGSRLSIARIGDI